MSGVNTDRVFSIVMSVFPSLVISFRLMYSFSDRFSSRKKSRSRGVLSGKTANNPVASLVTWSAEVNCSIDIGLSVLRIAVKFAKDKMGLQRSRATASERATLAEPPKAREVKKKEPVDEFSSVQVFR